jgi:hypothetical protein
MLIRSVWPFKVASEGLGNEVRKPYATEVYLGGGYEARIAELWIPGGWLVLISQGEVGIYT